MLRVGAALLTYQPGPEVTRSLDALIASEVMPGWVVVVDNASPSWHPDLLRQTHPDLHVLVLPHNVGYGAAMNAAADALRPADPDALLFLTQETLLEAGALARMVEVLSADPRIGVVGPRLDRLSVPAQVWSTGGEITGIRRRPVHGTSTEPADGTVARTTWLDGACLLVRAEPFYRLGSFRSDLFLYWEDVDLCLRMQRLGLSVVCATDAVAWQEPGMMPPYLDARNKVLVLGRAGAVGAALDVGARAAADLLHRRGLERARLTARGLVDGLRHRPPDESLRLRRPS